MGKGELTEPVMAVVMRKEGRKRSTLKREERPNDRGCQGGWLSVALCLL